MDVNQDCYFDTLGFLGGGSTISFTSGLPITINSFLFTNATPTNPIHFQSDIAGTAATLSQPSGIVCIENIFMQDIHTAGGAQFFAARSR